MTYKVGMVSLGCSKNQVDAERLLGMVRQEGFEICADATQCDAVIINTCGFIEDAKQESINTILEFAGLKQTGKLRVLAVTGCLAERYREQVAQELPEADVILGIGSNAQIGRALRDALDSQRKTVSFGKKTELSLEGERVLSNAPYFAYLKVAEGCSNCCSYCAIPMIRGPFRSRPMETVEEEARMLARQGVTELCVVAQDTTRYGEDLYGKLTLPELLRRLCKIEGLRWVRLLYCYPERITEELLDVMAREDKIVKYLDLPLQHASGRILQLMNRPGDEQSLRTLLTHIRERVPGIVLRTTLIAGFPGETEDDFSQMLRFIEDMRFERLGCFAYSQEEDTPAADMPDQLDEEERRRRAGIVMERQYKIQQAFNQSQNGRRLSVLVEGKKGKYWYGRSYMDAPDIDTRVYFTSAREHEAGEYVQVEIAGARGYDLLGKAVSA